MPAVCKIAISGKGGSGKTTISAGLIRLLVEKKKSVIAVDCDPDQSLGLSLGFPEYNKIQPISEMKDLIARRVESDPLKPQGFFKLNPQVDDIPEKYCPQHQGVRLIVMGKVEKPQGGCLCPENTFIRSLVGHLVLRQDEFVVLDMAAGSEHLGRATARGVDCFLIVIEPSETSLKTSQHIRELAKGLGIERIHFVGNKIKNKEDIAFLESSLGKRLAGKVGFNKDLEASRGRFIFDDSLRQEFEDIYQAIGGHNG